jgi:hypothetical protein
MPDLAATVDQLSQRVAALEAENARLRAEARPEPVSRRNALRLGGLAAGAAAAGVFLRPGTAHAIVDNPIEIGVDNDAVAGSTGLTSTNGTDTLHLTNTGTGEVVHVEATNSSSAKNGVTVNQSGRGHGVYAHIGNVSNGSRAVFGHTLGFGGAVVGGIANTNSAASAVLGSTSGFGPGVEGRSDKGSGGKFAGKDAQLWLLPASASSHPSSGQKGQLFVDSSGRLWFCKGGATWKQLA